MSSHDLKQRFLILAKVHNRIRIVYLAPKFLLNVLFTVSVLEIDKKIEIIKKASVGWFLGG